MPIILKPKRTLLDAIQAHEQRAEYIFHRLSILDSIVKRYHQFLQAEVCTIFLVPTKEESLLQIVASYSDRDLFLVRTEHVVTVQTTPGAGLTGAIAAMGVPFRESGRRLRGHIYCTGRSADHLKNEICHSLLAAPIFSVTGKLRGLLKFENKQNQVGDSSDEIAFSAEDELVAVAAAREISDALDEAHRLEVFLTLLKPSSNTLPNPDFFAEMAEAIRIAFHCAGVLIYMADEKNRVLPAVVFSGAEGNDFNPIEFKYHYDTVSLATKVFKENAPYVTNDPQNDPNVNSDGWRKFDISGPLAGMPITIDDKRLGVLVLWKRVGESITQETVDAVGTLCRPVAAYMVERHVDRSFGTMCHTLLENLPAGLFIKDESLRILFCNKAFCTFVREKFESILGKRDIDVFNNTPELAREFSADDMQVLSTGVPISKMERSATVDGDVRFAQVAKTRMYISPEIPRALQGVFIDVTEREIAEKANIARVGYWWWDTTPASDKVRGTREVYELFEFVEASDAQDRGVTFERIIGRIFSEDQTRIREAIATLRKAPAEFVAYFRMKRGDGSVRAIEMRGKPSNDDQSGVAGLLIGTVRDITNDVVQVNVEAQEIRITTAAQLVASFRHDIFNTLDVARLAWHVLNQQANADKSWEKIRVAVDTAMQLIGLLESLFKTGSGEVGIYDVNDIIQTAIILESDRLKESHVDVEHMLSTGLPRVYANRAHLVAAVHNLLKNAREASPPGSLVRIVVSSSELSRFSERGILGTRFFADSVVRVQVFDQGKGLSPETEKRKFQVGWSTKGVERGTGLYSCRRIAALYGGQVTLENRSDCSGAVAQIVLKGSSINTIHETA